MPECGESDLRVGGGNFDDNRHSLRDSQELDALHHRFEFDGEPTMLAGFQFWKGYVPDGASSLIVLSQSGIKLRRHAGDDPVHDLRVR